MYMSMICMYVYNVYMHVYEDMVKTSSKNLSGILKMKPRKKIIYPPPPPPPKKKNIYIYTLLDKNKYRGLFRIRIKNNIRQLREKFQTLC